MNKYNLKVGDQVVVATDKYLSKEYNRGQVVSVVSIDGNTIACKSASNDRFPGLNFTLEQITLLTTKQDTSMTFKVGDKVKIAKTSKYYSRKVDNNPQDTVGTISDYRTTMDSDSLNITVVWPNGQNTYNDKDLELAEDMTKIEVGDTIISKGYPREYTVTVVTDRGYDVKETFGFVATKDAVLVRKASKGEVIGYELLKDLPGIPAGSKSQISAAMDYKFGNDTTGATSYYKKDKLMDTTWFKPIYKPTEVKVQTTPGDVIVTKDLVTLPGETGIETKYVDTILTRVSDWSVNIRCPYEIKVETFKVGCKTFHVNDIPKLEAAIKQVS